MGLDVSGGWRERGASSVAAPSKVLAHGRAQAELWLYGSSPKFAIGLDRAHPASGRAGLEVTSGPLHPFPMSCAKRDVALALPGAGARAFRVCDR